MRHKPVGGRGCGGRGVAFREKLRKSFPGRVGSPFRTTKPIRSTFGATHPARKFFAELFFKKATPRPPHPPTALTGIAGDYCKFFCKGIAKWGEMGYNWGVVFWGKESCGYGNE